MNLIEDLREILERRGGKRGGRKGKPMKKPQEAGKIASNLMRTGMFSSVEWTSGGFDLEEKPSMEKGGMSLVWDNSDGKFKVELHGTPGEKMTKEQFQKRSRTIMDIMSGLVRFGVV